MEQSTRHNIYVFILFVFTINTYSQQSFKYSKDILLDFCSLDVLKNENVEDYSNITEWVKTNLDSLFFGFGPYSLSSRNESGFMSLGVYDDKKGITIPIYDNKIVFSPTPRPKKRAGRNRYSLKTECVLSMLNYCNENYITAFDFNYNSYFEIGAYRLNLNIRQIIAHTINTCVDYDFRKDESAVEMFINAVNKNEGLDDIKIPDDDKDNEFNNLVKALQAQYNERQILFLIYITFIDKDNPHETEEALNKFYRSFTNEQFIPFINEELNYNLKIAFEDSGYLTFSKDIIELVNKDTKEVISDGTDYVKIPIYNIVDFKFAIDNVPRLFISFDIDNRDKKMYKVNTGFNRTPLKKYEKISKENPKYLELAHVNIVYYNNRIQVTITSSEDDWNHYESFQIINEKRQTL